MKRYYNCANLRLDIYIDVCYNEFIIKFQEVRALREKNDLVIEYRANLDELAEMARACHEAGIPETKIAGVARTFMLFGLQILPSALKYKRQKYTKEEALHYLKQIGIESLQFGEKLSKQVALGLALESMKLTAKDMELIHSRMNVISGDIELVDASTDPDISKFLDEK